MRLVGLSEKAEVPRYCRYFGDVVAGDPGVHRIGSISSNTGCPSTLIIKFLKFRDKKRVLKVAQIKGKILYDNKQVRFHSDLSAGVQKRQ